MCVWIFILSKGSPFHHNYYEEGLEKDFFIRTSSGQVWTGYSNATLLDLTNPSAYQWMVDIIAEVGRGRRKEEGEGRI